MMRHLLHEMAQWNWGGIAFVVLILPASGYMTHLLRVWSMREPKVKEKPRRAIELSPAFTAIAKRYLTQELIAHKMMSAATPKRQYIPSPSRILKFMYAPLPVMRRPGPLDMPAAEMEFILAQPRRKG